MYHVPWEPTTFIFRGYNPYKQGLKHSFFMVLGSKGVVYSHGSVYPCHKLEKWIHLITALYIS